MDRMIGTDAPKTSRESAVNQACHRLQVAVERQAQFTERMSELLAPVLADSRPVDDDPCEPHYGESKLANLLNSLADTLDRVHTHNHAILDRVEL